MGFAAQATYWSAVDLHRAVMPRICEALSRPIREQHPDVASAMAAKVDLLLSGVAVDVHARFAVENEASKLYETSPWVADKRAAEIVRPAPVQTDEWVPPKSLARDMAFAKLRSRLLSGAEAVQAAKLHAEQSPEQQAIMLSAGGPGTGTSAGQQCTNHRRNWHSMRSGGCPRRCGLARRRMPARAPYVL